MNCKPGDMAIVVRSFAGNEGRVVTCLRFIGMKRWRDKSGNSEEIPSWEIDQELAGFCGNLNNVIADNQLRPIRDNPGNESWFKAAPIKTKEVV